jgi:hypothetical protein
MEVEVSEGDWVLFSNGGYRPLDVACKRACKVTPRLVKFEGPLWPRQCNRLSVVASFSDETTARTVANKINGGVSGEYEKRRQDAEDERSRRITAALQTGRDSIAKIIAEAGK